MTASRWVSRPWQYAATTAGVGAVVGLAAAPWPTLYVVGPIAAAVILFQGIRLLANERREPPEHAARCADVPGLRGLLEHAGIDTAGRDITVGGKVVDAAPKIGPAWQAIADAVATLPPPVPPHPDAALRGRVAAALIARIKQAVIVDPAPFSGMVGQPFGATEYDLADAALAEMAPELEQLGRAEAALAQIATLAFDANLRPDVRLSRIRNVISPADDEAAPSEGSAR